MLRSDMQLCFTWTNSWFVVAHRKEAKNCPLLHLIPGETRRTRARRGSIPACGYNAAGLRGMAVSPDDCSLALRGLQTLPIRLSAVETSALIKTVFTGDPSEQTGPYTNSTNGSRTNTRLIPQRMRSWR